MKKKYIITGLIFFIGMFAVGITIYLGIILFGNYAIDNKQLVMNEATTIVDKDGQEVTKLFKENRELVSIDDIPDHVQNAFVAAEDHRFYSHQGFDVRSIGRALYRDILSGSKVEGGSTITQQLVKNVFLTTEKTWLRKTKEILIAMNLEKRYSKDEILEMYLNRIYFGHGAHGIQAASYLYFGKDVSELGIEEGALLAALPKAPNNYSPFVDRERSKVRRDLVLSIMEQRGYLDAEEAVRLQGRSLPTTANKLVKNEAYASYVDLVLSEVEDVYGFTKEEILSGGYEIVVEMDRGLQEAAYGEFSDSSNFPESMGENPVEGSLVLMDHTTGGVMAVQGGRNYVEQGFHRVNAKRQPGSIFKPISVYAHALESGEYGPYSLLKDELVDYDGYTPKNYNNKYQGEITMYDAIKDSSNAAAVWLLNQIGVDGVKESLEKMDFQLEEEGLALALGGLHEGVSPLEMATAYSIFANGGYYVEPYFIKEIYDREGDLISAHEVEKEQIISSQTAWYLTRMLESVVSDGTGRAGEYEGALAGKTGTTSYNGVQGAIRDIWFAGYTPYVTGAIWMGYDRTDENNYLTAGSNVPTALFKKILDHSPRENSLVFETPSHIKDLEEPIRLAPVRDLTANMSFGWRGMSVKLEWTSSEDDRVQYHIYQMKDDGSGKKIDEVTGKNEYTLYGVNLFNIDSYVVVPYNPQIDRLGEQSNYARAQYNLFSQE